MSVEADNVAILRGAYEAWADARATDLTPWTAIVAEDARLSSPTSQPGRSAAGPRSGHSEIIDYLANLTTDWDMIFCRVDEFVAQGDRVVAVGTVSWRHKTTGNVVVTPKVDLWRMRRGKVIQFAEVRETARACAVCPVLAKAGPPLPPQFR